jgi:aryl-phospho-beta-D-glucosidase BglC (GH1 family)
MLWTQIAEYFRDYDYKLIFEGFNELNDKDDSWKFSSACASINNTLNQAFVDAVRSTGGNNTYRILVCGTYLNETSNRTLNSFVLPDDIVANRLVIAVHLYDSTMGSTLTDTFKRLQKFSSSQGAPVIIDEFGTKSDFSPAENRDIQAGKYVANANLCGIKCFWWDDGGDYAIFDRKTEKVSEPDVVYALMHPEEFSDITSKNID